MNTEGTISRASKGHLAYNAAVRRLRELHPDDWTRLLWEEREKVGLPGDPESPAIRTLNDETEAVLGRIRELEERLAGMMEAR